MSSPIVLIIFYSICGATEKLALAAAVGAVQARAKIRLRRLSDRSPTPSDLTSDCISNLERMQKEYVPPAQPDLEGADAIILGLPARLTASSPAWIDLRGLLTELRNAGELDEKVGAGLEPMPEFFPRTLLELGFGAAAAASDGTEIPPEAAALALGRRVAEQADTLGRARDPR